MFATNIVKTDVYISNRNYGANDVWPITQVWKANLFVSWSETGSWISPIHQMKIWAHLGSDNGLMAPSHCLNLYWLISNGDLQHTLDTSFTRSVVQNNWWLMTPQFVCARVHKLVVYQWSNTNKNQSLWFINILQTHQMPLTQWSAPRLWFRDNGVILYDKTNIVP